MPKGIVVKHAKSAAQIAEEEIIIPLEENPKYADSLEWLKELIDEEIAFRKYGWDESPAHVPLPPKNEEMGKIWEEPLFKKFMEYNEFFFSNQGQSGWKIPMDFNKSELESISDVIESIVNSTSVLNSKNIDLMKCKKCGNSFTNLLQHLNKSKYCPASYSEKDMADLKAAKAMYSKFQKKEWYKENKETLSKKMAEYHKQNREAILNRKKENGRIRKRSEKKK